MATDTSKYLLNHTMLRVKDPERSVKFYEFLGMNKISQIDNPAGNFSLHFLAYDGADAPSAGRNWTDRQGVLELTHNYGTEKDDGYKVANGNAEPGKGFGHICVSVDNIQASCQRLEDAGYGFQKKLSDGRMRHIAFALDPDGYWVEIISANDVKTMENVRETDTQSYRFVCLLVSRNARPWIDRRAQNHSMIRVKDVDASLKFYQEVMGMTLIRTNENPSANFNLYFLAYPGHTSEEAAQPRREGILELTWNYGTEKDPDFRYHDGNAEPQGFGHIAVSVDDLDAACARLEERGVRWKKRLADGKLRDLAFVLDPDGYWIEVIQNEAYKKRAGW